MRLLSAREANDRWRQESPENSRRFRYAARQLREEWDAMPKRTLHCIGRDEIQVRADLSPEEMIGHAIACWSLSGRVADYEIVTQGADLRMRLRREVDGG